MTDLFVHEHGPRQTRRTTTRWKVEVPTDDPMGVWKRMRARCAEARHAYMEREQKDAIWNFDSEGEPCGFSLAIHRNRLFIVVDTESVRRPTVELRSSLFRTWHVETYEVFDDSDSVLRSFAYLIEAGGVDPHRCKTEMLSMT